MKILNNIIEFFVTLFGHSKKVELTPMPAPQPTVPKEPKPNSPSIPPNNPVDQSGDPDVTDPSAQVQTFLWKPISDTNPIVSVITVSADAIRSDELFVEIYDKANKIITGLIPGKNQYSSGRGNPLPGFKYGRINFKPGWTDKQFSKSAPIKIKFYTVVKGKRLYVKVLGKDYFEVKDPIKRIEQNK